MQPPRSPILKTKTQKKPPHSPPIRLPSPSPPIAPTDEPNCPDLALLLLLRAAHSPVSRPVAVAAHGSTRPARALLLLLRACGRRPLAHLSPCCCCCAPPTRPEIACGRAEGVRDRARAREVAPRYRNRKAARPREPDPRSRETCCVFYTQPVSICVVSICGSWGGRAAQQTATWSA